ANHRARRDKDWQTLEAPLDLPGTLRGLPPAQVCMVDCLTLWASNRMLANHDPEQDLAELIAALGEARGRLILVSNEIGMGLVPGTPMGRRFRDIQGRLNQAVAKQADIVLFVAAGLPLALKGSLPEGLS
ncbi:MAG: bifunctional adenosylcobinamide kinase/adenosylcobinamide-phosphate guanylyltransferase, partial [Halocynthiibacter sp.]